MNVPFLVGFNQKKVFWEGMAVSSQEGIYNILYIQLYFYVSGQIIATSAEVTTYGGLVRGIPPKSP